MGSSSWIILSALLMLANVATGSSARSAENVGGTADNGPGASEDGLSTYRARLEDELSAYRARLKDDPTSDHALRLKDGDAGTGLQPPVKSDATSARRPLPEHDAPSVYQARAQKKLDDDERAWKRLTNSICVGCGSPSQPAKTAPVTPGNVLARPSAPSGDLVAQRPATAGATAPARVAAAPQKRLRYARLRRQLLSQARPVANVRQRSRLTPRYARLRRQLLSQARPVARIHHGSQRALLDPAWGHRRLARSRVRYAGQVWRARRTSWRAQRVVGIRRRFVAFGSNWVSSRDRGHSPPHRAWQRYALCTYGYGPFSLLGSWPSACVSSR
jgi:hypothetical protein